MTKDLKKEIEEVVEDALGDWSEAHTLTFDEDGAELKVCFGGGTYHLNIDSRGILFAETNFPLTAENIFKVLFFEANIFNCLTEK